jgi:putative ABC transport system ATP-binding protein
MTAIKCVDLCKYFQQGDAVIKALDHVSLEIEEGSFICLSGPSGSGKTTLLNAIGGLDSLDSGEIYFDGRRVDQLGKGPMADLRLHHTAKERRGKSLAILREVGLEGMESRYPAQLSGGQQQRVAVARAIVSRPKLVLADEPTANLDSETATQLMDLLVELNESHNATFLIATHDQRVMQYAKRLIQMQDGKIIADKKQDVS